MENKKFNWKTFGWICLNIFIIIALNTTIIVFLCYNFIGDIKIEYKSEWLKFSNFDLLEWYEKGCIYLFMIVGVVLSFGWFKLLFKKHISEKQTKKLVEVEDKKEKQLEKLLEKILEGKK